MKSYTDIKQSKKLAEFLPIESADLCYIANSELINIHEPFFKKMDEGDIPCWSLAALLNVLPDDCGIDKENGKYVASYIISDECGCYTENNPVDSCVIVIEYLHELKIL